MVIIRMKYTIERSQRVLPTMTSIEIRLMSRPSDQILENIIDDHKEAKSSVGKLLNIYHESHVVIGRYLLSIQELAYVSNAIRWSKIEN
ncbi:hypothetical protein P8452_55444 [Trifolium repens]|nr:hypothetical protein P8452_55444 [Trifolium repens]